MTPREDCGVGRRSLFLLSSILSREMIPERSSPSCSVLNPCYRSLIRKAYKRASANPKKVFKTKLTGDVEGNPVYDVAYSPVSYPGYSVVAVGDELGFLSVVKIPVRVRRKRGNVLDNAQTDNDVNDSVATVYGTQEPDSRWLDRGEVPPVQPVVYSLAWNPDGNKILTGYGDGSIRIWDLEKSATGKPASVIQCSEKSLKRVAWCRQETFISCSRTNEVYLHDQRMRNPLANRIDCNQISSKLTDVCALSDVYVLASSSNQSHLHLFDLRKTYKLYKRITPVESFDVKSPGYTSLKTDRMTDDGVVYALGSDSVVRSLEYRRGAQLCSYHVPEPVDFFTKIDVDRREGVLVSGSCGDSAWGFDLVHPSPDTNLRDPFFRLRENSQQPDTPDEHDDADIDKENEQRNETTNNNRSFSAVALPNSNRKNFVQIACGGDNSTIIEYTL